MPKETLAELREKIDQLETAIAAKAEDHAKALEAKEEAHDQEMREKDAAFDAYVESLEQRWSKEIDEAKDLLNQAVHELEDPRLSTLQDMFAIAGYYVDLDLSRPSPSHTSISTTPAEEAPQRRARAIPAPPDLPEPPRHRNNDTGASPVKVVEVDVSDKSADDAMSDILSALLDAGVISK